MRFWKGLVMLFFVTEVLAAQGTVIDSLTLQLALLEKEPLAEDYRERKASLSLHLGQTFHDRGACQEAGKYLGAAHRLSIQTGDSLLLASALNLLGVNNFEKGVTDSAIYYLKEGLQVAAGIQSFEHVKNASAQLYVIHKEKHDHAEALRYFELYQSAKDTLIKGEHIRTITRLEKDYNTRIERYEDTAKLQRQQLISVIAISGFSIAVLIIILMIVYYRLKQIKERAMRKIQDQLIIQERMASLGMLTAGIVHEIKNPLNFINNFAGVNRRLVTQILTEINIDPSKNNPQVSQSIRSRLHDLEQNSIDIQTSGKEINRIVHTMMDHSRGSSGSLQMIDLNALAEENIKLVYQSYRASHPGLQVEIINRFEPGLPKIEVYPNSISRVMINILSNALYALNLKQEEQPDFTPCLDISTRSDPDSIELTIWDNGPGIPLVLQQKIFTPFFTTKPVGLGNSGLGLSISYNIIVHEHHGKLEVESEPGVFTQFRIVLPSSLQK